MERGKRGLEKPFLFVPQHIVPAGKMPPFSTEAGLEMPFFYGIEEKEHLSFSEWERRVEKALEAIEKGLFQKVVLSKKVSFFFHHPIDPCALLRSLALYLEKNELSCTLFALLFSKERAFLGASPEMLYERKGNKLWTEALAGTRALKGVEPSSLALELLHSAKDKKEIEFIETFLSESLRPFIQTPPCKQTLSWTDLHVVQAPLLLHLRKQLRLELTSSCENAHLLKALHPTPAVLGYPRAAAEPWLQEIECIPRGWYASAIGWSQGDASQWAVGIRSAFIEKNRLDIQVGCGIVKGSDPKKEWEELGHKCALWKKILQT